MNHRRRRDGADVTAAPIAALRHHEAMSSAARDAVAGKFDIRDRVADYQALFARWQELDAVHAASPRQS